MKYAGKEVLKMDELFTIEEMRSKLKVSRDTMYRYMKDGILPFVVIGGHRRFIGSQVMKSIRDMQARQAQAAISSGRDYTLSASREIPDNGRKDTLSASRSRRKARPSKAKPRVNRRSKKRPYKTSKSETD